MYIDIYTYIYIYIYIYIYNLEAVENGEVKVRGVVCRVTVRLQRAASGLQGLLEIKDTPS